jgi:methylsterol monooxygenase/4-alpha-methyl-delta7-sterol-4alpha-methyl oxidase
VESHSGYRMSWSPFRVLPFAQATSYHDFHHSHNVGNYSSTLTFWDHFFSTNAAYFSYLKQKRKSK